MGGDVRAMSSWSAADTGGIANDDIRNFKVNPDDALNVVFVVIQINDGSSDWNKNTAQRFKAALQVKMCSDGSVRGIDVSGHTSSEVMTSGTCRHHQHTETGQL